MWEEPDVLRQFQEHVLESTKNAYSLEDTKKHVTNNSKYTSFMRKGRLSQEQADNTRNELDDKVNIGLHPYRCGFTPSCGMVRMFPSLTDASVSLYMRHAFCVMPHACLAVVSRCALLASWVHTQSLLQQTVLWEVIKLYLCHRSSAQRPSHVYLNDNPSSCIVVTRYKVFQYMLLIHVVTQRQCPQ